MNAMSGAIYIDGITIDNARLRAYACPRYSNQQPETEPPPTKVEGFSGLERLRRTVESFPTEVGGFKPDFLKLIEHNPPFSPIIDPPPHTTLHGQPSPNTSIMIPHPA